MADQVGAQQLIGRRMVDREGKAIGKIAQVYFDDQTDVPTWVTVRLGLFGSRENFVPLNGAAPQGDSLKVPFPKTMVRKAPRFDSDQHISVEQEDEVYRHYGLEIPGQWIPSRGRHAAPEPAIPAPVPSMPSTPPRSAAPPMSRRSTASPMTEGFVPRPSTEPAPERLNWRTELPPGEGVSVLDGDDSAKWGTVSSRNASNAGVQQR